MNNDNELDKSTMESQRLEIRGVIVGRRCLGKSLSFVTLAPATSQDEDQRDESSHNVKVTFQRNYFEEQASVNESKLDEAHNDYTATPLPFPVKVSDMPYGAHVQINVAVVTNPANAAKDSSPQRILQARCWSLMGEHPRTQALRLATSKGSSSGVSCTQYLKTRGDLYLSLHNQKSPAKEKRVVPKSASALHQTIDTLINDNPHAGASSHRAKIFAEWLMENMTLLHSDQPIALLDVAGGKGQLSIELAKRGVACSVMDPLIRSKRSRQKLNQSRQHLPTNIPSFVVAYFEQNDATDLIVAEYNCLVGLHPDECTETIVDKALQHHKNFAVVPCLCLSVIISHETTK